MFGYTKRKRPGLPTVARLHAMPRDGSSRNQPTDACLSDVVTRFLHGRDSQLSTAKRMAKVIGMRMELVLE
mgnify:FL=1